MNMSCWRCHKKAKEVLKQLLSKEPSMEKVEEFERFMMHPASAYWLMTLLLLRGIEK